MTRGAALRDSITLHLIKSSLVLALIFAAYFTWHVAPAAPHMYPPM